MLDYLEGNLDPLLAADLMAFLAENPEYEKYLPEYDPNFSLAGSCEYPQKNLLKKEFAQVSEITPENFDEFCIASCEGLLQNADLKRLSDYISAHPGSQHDLNLYRKIILKPETAVQFRGKNKLKKGPATSSIRYLYYAAGLAASVTLLLMLVLHGPAETELTQTQPVKTIRPERPPQEPMKHEGETVGVLPQKHMESPARETNPVEERKVESSMLLTMAAIDPISDVRVRTSSEPPPVTYHLPAKTQSLPGNQPDRTGSADSFADSRLGNLLRRLDYWKTANSAISGFNYLTESQLSVDKITDESGKVTSLLIESESFSFSGNKIK